MSSECDHVLFQRQQDHLTGQTISPQCLDHVSRILDHPPGIAKGEELDMKRILVPLSGRKPHEAIVPLVDTLAKPSGATVRLLRVFPVPELIMRSPDLVGSRGRVVAYADQQMAGLTSQGLGYLKTVEAQFDGIPIESVVRFGDPVQEILLDAETFGADLIAFATTSRSWLRSALSPSVAEQVARKAAIPAVVLRVIAHKERADRQGSWRTAWLALVALARRTLVGVGARPVQPRIKRI